MSSPLVLFVLLAGFGLALCLWTAASAAVRVAEHGGTHRAWTLIAATMLPPVTACAALSAQFGHPELEPIIVLLPILIIAGTWSSMMTMRDQGLLLKLLHLPVVAFNTSLAGIYAVHAGQELSGFDLGTWGTAITGGHSLLQTWIGHPQAGTQTVWLHLPLLMPLWLRYRWHHTLVLGMSSIISLAMLGLLVVSMPIAYQHAELFRKPLENSMPATLPLVGVKVGWGDRVIPASTRDQWRSQFLGLGAGCLVVDVNSELFADPELFEQVRAEIDLARAAGARIALICRPLHKFQWLPAADFRTIAEEMSKAHWLAAERLNPDLMILYAGPFGQLRHLSHDSPTIDQWREQILRSVHETKQANPDVKVAVAFENLAAHTKQLFTSLAHADSPLDALCFVVHATSMEPKEQSGALQDIHKWCVDAETKKPIWIIEAGANPQTSGGELGQWHFLEGLLADASRVGGIECFCIDALTDGITSYGITTNAGRQRLAYRELQYLLLPRIPSSPR